MSVFFDTFELLLYNIFNNILPIRIFLHKIVGSSF